MFPQAFGARESATGGAVAVVPDCRHSRTMVACRVDSPMPRAIPYGNGDRTQLQPDLLVYSATFGRAKSWREIGDHWVAVEVLSPSSRIYDRDFKRDAYFALGVKEVWLVDVEARAVEVSRAPGAMETVHDVVRWRVPDSGQVVTIDLAELFRFIG